MPETLVPLGRIVNTHAVRGELRVRLYNPSSTTLARGTRVVLQRETLRQEQVVSGVRPHKQFALVTLESCDSITAAEALIGFEVCVREEDLPPAAEGKIYHYQLIGMTVVTVGGETIGVVKEMLTTASADICVVRDDAREHLIPLIADIVKAVDRENRRIVIEPLPGLLEP